MHRAQGRHGWPMSRSRREVPVAPLPTFSARPTSCPKRFGTALRGRAREEVRERVRAAAVRIGYGGPDPKGRLLRAGKVNAIGVATAEPLAYFFDDPFARVVMSGISQACDAPGAGISLVSAGNEETLAWNIQSALVDGFIVFCIEGGSRLIE